MSESGEFEMSTDSMTGPDALSAELELALPVHHRLWAGLPHWVGLKLYGESEWKVDRLARHRR